MELKDEIAITTGAPTGIDKQSQRGSQQKMRHLLSSIMSGTRLLLKEPKKRFRKRARLRTPPMSHHALYCFRKAFMDEISPNRRGQPFDVRMRGKRQAQRNEAGSVTGFTYFICCGGTLRQSHSY